MGVLGELSGGVPPTMAKKVFAKSSRRLVLTIEFARPFFLDWVAML